MSILHKEYIEILSKGGDCSAEIKNLIKEYKSKTNRDLFIYFGADVGLPNLKNHICQDDYYIIYDLLKNAKEKNIDILISTPGGSGEATEEIGNFLQSKFDNIRFIVAGEAKSAGTILVMSGDEICLTKTGSLGPIDAQIPTNNGFISAYDYVEWVEEKRNQMDDMRSKKLTPMLNPVDAVMIAQINPGYIGRISHSLEFGKDLVKNWLYKRKFKNWNITETKGTKVDDKKKQERAKEIADKLANHAFWRTHGRSIKYDDLEDWIKIELLDDNPAIADIIYRLDTICRLRATFLKTFKFFVYGDNLLSYNVSLPTNTSFLAPVSTMLMKSIQENGFVPVDLKCPKCKNKLKFALMFTDNEEKIQKAKKVNNKIVSKDIGTYSCDKCHTIIDLNKIRQEMVSKAKT